MKKILFVLSLTILLGLMGCGKKEKKDYLYLSIEEVSMSEDYLTIVLKPEASVLSKYNADKIGFIYGSQSKANDLVIETALLQMDEGIPSEDKVAFQIKEIPEAQYGMTLLIRPYVKDKSGKTHYASNTKKVTLLELANTSSGELAERILAHNEGRMVNEVHLRADYKKYTVESLEDKYKATLKTDYNYITITIEMKYGNVLNKDFKLVVNEKEIDKKEYTLNDGIITYKLQDPNWTKPY